MAKHAKTVGYINSGNIRLNKYNPDCRLTWSYLCGNTMCSQDRGCPSHLGCLVVAFTYLNDEFQGVLKEEL